MKIEANWDISRKMLDTPPRGTNNDKGFLNLLDKYRTVNPDNNIYMDALKKEISRIIIGFDKVREELIIYVYCQSEGSFIVSLHMPGNRTLTELWVLINKVYRLTELNELLSERLKEFASKVSPEVTSLPYEVKFFKDNMIQTCSLDFEALTILLSTWYG